MILFLYGPDTFRSRQYLAQSIVKFKKERDPQGYNVVVLDAKKTESGKIFSEISAAPFLAEKRLIVLENLLSNNDKELLQATSYHLQANKFPENNVVIFWQGEALSKVKAAKELEAILAKEKYAREFAPLSGAKLAEWITNEVKIRGGSIAPDALNYVAANVGSDTWLLNSLINQLIAYSGATRPIAVADVGLFLSEKVDDNIFNMVDAIASGNRKTAFRLLTEQRRLGEEDGKLFGLILWQFKILLQIADFLEREEQATSDVVAKQLGIHPFVAKKNFALAKHYSLAKLEASYERLLIIDIKTKTGQADQGLLIDLFVAAV
ncbi:MAG: DNA polymerase III subunit delta [Candidatus Magasanikbacteria bacterium]|nr:DNA polymerase III subunit delta [Candidatus Magasanikbacteria bacterium]